MARPRKIVFLMMMNGQLYKSVNFRNFKYVGDPINSVKIFSDFQVDELILVDIDCSSKNSNIKFELLNKIAKNAKMPIVYGGGIRRVSQIQTLLELGFDRVMMSHHALCDLSLVENAAKRFGSQSIITCIDVRFSTQQSRYDVFTQNGTYLHRKSLFEAALDLQGAGAGEIVINSIDRDGTYLGFDKNILAEVHNALNVPLTLVGGAENNHQLESTANEFKVNLAAGSIWTFYKRTDSVLLTYH